MRKILPDQYFVKWPDTWSAVTGDAEGGPGGALEDDPVGGPGEDLVGGPEDGVGGSELGSDVDQAPGSAGAWVGFQGLGTEVEHQAVVGVQKTVQGRKKDILLLIYVSVYNN